MRPNAIRTAIFIGVGMVLGLVIVGLMHLALDAMAGVLQYPIDLGLRLVFIVGLLLLGAALLFRFGLRSGAAGLVGGAAIGWGFRSGHVLDLCASGRLFRPCTDVELILTIAPPALLAVLGLAFGLAAFRRARLVQRVK
jgi:hypothetical protein